MAALEPEEKPKISAFWRRHPPWAIVCQEHELNRYKSNRFDEFDLGDEIITNDSYTDYEFIGLADKPEFTFAEIGLEIGVSAGRAQAICERALGKIRHQLFLLRCLYDDQY